MKSIGLYRGEKAKARILDSYDRLLDNWGVPVESIDLQTRYGATRVNAAGDKALPPLILLHGVGDDSALMWIYNARELSRNMRLYAVDTLGGPGRSIPNESYNEGYDDALWLDDVLEGLNIDCADIAGVSHGGYLAQMYAVERPGKVSKIACLAASVPVGKGSPMKTMMKIFLPEAAFPTKRNIVKLLKKLTGEHSEAFTENELILEHFTALLKGYNNMAMRYHKTTAFDESRITALRDKALYLAGDADPFMTLGGKDALLRLGMNARFYANAGHGLNHELPDEINGELARWFAE